MSTRPTRAVCIAAARNLTRYMNGEGGWYWPLTQRQTDAVLALLVERIDGDNVPSARAAGGPGRKGARSGGHQNGPAADSPIHRVPRDVDTVAGPTHHNKGEQR